VNEVQTFLLEDAGVRGALVRLRETWRHATAQHNYPAEI
jgi:redox-regulated HSP33 family molecular chaperone